MGDTIFVQFCNKIKNAYFDLCNGFSDTHDLCRNKGDFWWTEHEADGSKWYTEETYAGRQLPIEKGTVYISAVYLNHLYQAYVWAGEYPDIQFVVGGPVAAEQCAGGNGWNPVYFELRPGIDLPKNLTLTGMSVEDWLGAPNFSCNWRLDIPPSVPPDSPIYFSYTLDNHCFWRKCIYCNIALHDGELYRRRLIFKFEFKNIDHQGVKRVRLNTGSITPAHIRNLFPKLPRGKDMEYRLFMRPAQPENDALREVLDHWKGDLPNLMLGLGIEFPSNRMLKYAGKGFNTAEMLETLRICRQYHLHVNGNFMLGWNNLTEADMRELEDFMAQMPEGSIGNMQMRWLFAHPFTEIHENYRGEEIHLGPFYIGFRTKIDAKQMAFNKKACDIVKRYSLLKQFKLEGMKKIENHLQEGQAN